MAEMGLELRKLRDKLEGSLFYTAFMMSPEIIFIHAPDGTIIHANPAAQEEMGYPMEALEEMNIRDMVQATDKDFHNRTGRLDGEDVVTFRANHRRKDGTTFEAEVRTRMVEVDGQKLVVGIGQDISNRQLADMLNVTLDRISLAVGSRMDFDQVMQNTISAARRTMGSDSAIIALREDDRWTVRYYDGRSKGMLGVQFTNEDSRSAALAQSTGQAVMVNDVRSDPRMNRAFAERFHIRSLLTVPLRVRGEIIGLMSFFCLDHAHTFTDAHVDFANKLVHSVSLILENVRLSETEKATSEFLKAVIETAPSGTVALDMSGHIIFANEAAEKILGIPKERLSARSFNDPDWRIADYDGGPFPEESLPFNVVMRTGRPVFGIRHAVERPDGQRVMLLLNAAPLHVSDGAPSGVVVSMEDVTSTVLSERALQASLKTSDDIVRQIPSGMLIFQYVPPDGLYLTSANRTADIMLGGMTNKLGMEFDQIWRQGAFFATKEEFVEIVTTGRTIWREGVHYSDKCVDGSFTFRAFCLPEDRLCVNFDDVTERIAEASLRREAYTQIEKNIEHFATLVDRIRNPLSAIIAQAESCERKGVAGISDRAEEIEDILKQLDQGWLESEKVRGFLKRSL